MEELVPDVVITFDTTGVSNHPDHIKICFATTFAFQKYSYWIEKQIKDYAPKLYYACLPESIVSFLKKKNIIPEESFGKPWVGTEDKLITTVINTKAFQAVKKKALLCHKTQQDDVNRFLSFANNPLVSREYFMFRMHGTREVFMGKKDYVTNRL